jgi:hypothetical protein
MSIDNHSTYTTKSFLDHHQDIITNYMYLGLLPFFIGAFGPWLFIAAEPFLIRLFLFYSSLIFVFLAGSLWAIAIFVNFDSSGVTNINHSHNLRSIHCAIICSLWPLGCYFLSPLYAVPIMLIGFLLLLLWEKKHINLYYPEWYQALRHKITFIVIACHMLVILNIVRADILI